MVRTELAAHQEIQSGDLRDSLHTSCYANFPSPPRTAPVGKPDCQACQAFTKHVMASDAEVYYVPELSLGCKDLENLLKVSGALLSTNSQQSSHMDNQYYTRLGIYVV